MIVPRWWEAEGADRRLKAEGRGFRSRLVRRVGKQELPARLDTTAEEDRVGGGDGQAEEKEDSRRWRRRDGG
ncbi:unnamed protein product [Linum trigynum]|uniref:Uncharacterized protein n=1 Tax=Linum trigynum TaxID=586398 RepID=A0AAV2D9H8_9ROSI